MFLQRVVSRRALSCSTQCLGVTSDTDNSLLHRQVQGQKVRISSGARNPFIARQYHTSCAFRGKSIFSYSDIDYVLSVKTGDQLHAGTDANVRIVLHSENGEQSKPMKLDYLFRDDFERGQLDMFQLRDIAHLKDIHKIEIWRDGKGLASDWFVDYIEIESTASRKRFLFPLFRWVKEGRRYVVRHMDNCLPQEDPEPLYRKEELAEKRKHYQCESKYPGSPAQVGVRACLDFTSFYLQYLFVKRKRQALFANNVTLYVKSVHPRGMECILKSQMNGMVCALLSTRF